MDGRMDGWMDCFFLCILCPCVKDILGLLNFAYSLIDLPQLCFSWNSGKERKLLWPITGTCWNTKTKRYGTR